MKLNSSSTWWIPGVDQLFNDISSVAPVAYSLHISAISSVIYGRHGQFQ